MLILLLFLDNINVINVAVNILYLKKKTVLINDNANVAFLGKTIQCMHVICTQEAHCPGMTHKCI